MLKKLLESVCHGHISRCPNLIRFPEGEFRVTSADLPLSPSNSVMLSSLQNITAHNTTTSTNRASTLATPCPFCNKHLAKYICPRCSQKYCSLECYRSSEHTACVEAFEQDGMKVSRGGR